MIDTMRVMSGKRTVNLSMPHPIAAEFDRLPKDHRVKKWSVIAGAMLALLDLTDEERSELFGRALTANESEQQWSILLEMTSQKALLSDIRKSVESRRKFLVKSNSKPPKHPPKSP